MTEIYNNLAQIIKTNKNGELKSLVLMTARLKKFLTTCSYIPSKTSDALLDDCFLDLLDLLNIKELSGLKCLKIHMGFSIFSFLINLYCF